MITFTEQNQFIQDKQKAVIHGKDSKSAEGHITNQIPWVLVNSSSRLETVQGLVHIQNYLFGLFFLGWRGDKEIYLAI